MQDFVGMQLISVMRAHRARAAELLSALGVHVGQEMILFQLWQRDGLNQTELTACLGVEPPTTTRMVQRMEASGLVERRTDPRDGRVVQVWLSPRGRALEGPVTKAWQTLESMTVGNLSAGERALLRELLAKVRLGLEPQGESA